MTDAVARARRHCTPVCGPRRRSRPGRHVSGRRLRRPTSRRADRPDGPGAARWSRQHGFAEYAGSRTSWRAATAATALVFNMHASVTGALAGIPEAMADALGVPPEFFAARDEILRRGRRRRVLRGGDERARRGIAPIRTDHVVRAGWRRVPDQGGEDVRLRGRARGRLSGRRPPLATTPRWSPSSWCRRTRRGLRVEATWDSLGMRATGSHDLHLDVDVPTPARCSAASRAWRCWFAQLMPHWLVASYAAVYVGVAQAARRCRGRAHRPAAASATARRSRRGWDAPTPRSAPRGWLSTRRRAGSTRDPGEPRRTDGCGGRSCWLATPRRRWRHRCWRLRARPPPAGATHLNGCSATRGAAHCNRPRRTCARTGWASRRSAGIPTRMDRRPDGDAAPASGIAHPPAASQEELWEGFFTDHYSVFSGPWPSASSPTPA